MTENIIPFPDRSPPAWLRLCIMSDAVRNPVPLSNLENAGIGLENDAALMNRFGFDEMRQQSMLLTNPPTRVTDTVVSQTTKYLQRCGLKQLTSSTVHEAIECFAREHRYHPIRDQLDALAWDGTGRLDRWTSYYLGVEHSDYSSAVGAMFLISMIARVYRPGCKVDHMLILEGPQGELKSTVCRILATPDYFSDSLPDIDQGKEVSVHLKGKWLVEIAELHAFSKTEATLLKSFVSRQVERYRPPYGRHEVEEPRQCVFIGTSNKEAYLRDETGGRRFWPLRCVHIDWEALAGDRDQLLAEACARFRNGDRWWPEKQFERSTIAPEQELRYEFDEWTPPVEQYLAACSTTTMQAVAKTALGLEIDRLDAAQQRRIGQIMTLLGWTRHKSKNRRWWERSPQADPLTENPLDP
ncbi:MAG TPA: virulence-associated E family protein [Stellaceae bacterium]|jgi:predicted P-loop ATPase|nr:virulence-associated E family protein [Stellaceae bacterium]